jgi:arsenate reductase
MAHGYLNFYCGDKANIYSAGIEVHGLNSMTIKVMMDDGIDISMYTSNNLEEYKSINFDIIITVCDHAKENCPFIYNQDSVRIHQNFTDPSKYNSSFEGKRKKFVLVRNEIKKFCIDFTNDNF